MRSRTCPLFRPQGGGELCQPRNRTWHAVPHQVAFWNVMGSYLRSKPTRIGAAIKGIRTAGPPWHADRRFVGEIKYSFASGTEGSNPLSSAGESMTRLSPVLPSGCRSRRAGPFDLFRDTPRATAGSGTPIFCAIYSRKTELNDPDVPTAK